MPFVAGAERQAVVGLDAALTTAASPAGARSSSSRARRYQRLLSSQRFLPLGHQRRSSTRSTYLSPSGASTARPRQSAEHRSCFGALELGRRRRPRRAEGASTASEYSLIVVCNWASTRRGRCLRFVLRFTGSAAVSHWRCQVAQPAVRLRAGSARQLAAAPSTCLERCSMRCRHKGKARPRRRALPGPVRSSAAPAKVPRGGHCPAPAGTRAAPGPSTIRSA